MSSAVVAALEQLQELCSTQRIPDTFKTVSRLTEARNDERRKQPVHHYRLLGLAQSCPVEEVKPNLNGSMHTSTQLFRCLRSCCCIVHT